MDEADLPTEPDAPDAPDDRVPGAPWMRLVGGAVDFVLVAAVVGAVASAWTTTQASNGGTVSRPTTAAYGLALTLRGLYHVVGVGAFGTTVGKRVMGLRVVGPDGRRAGWLRAGIRWAVSDLGWAAAWFTPHSWGGAGNLAWIVLNVAVYLPIVADRRARGLHDRAAGTTVVSERPRR